MDHDWYRAAGTALAVGVIGPLFWLGVNVLENQIKLLIGRFRIAFRARQAEKSARASNRLLK